MIRRKEGIQRIDYIGAFLVLGLIVFGFRLDNASNTFTKSPVPRQAVLYSTVTHYTFPAYRTIESPPVKKKVVKKKTVSRGNEIGIYTITAYCQGSRNAAGETPKIGTIAAPREIPLNTKVRIGDKIYIVKDRTNICFDKGLGNPETRFDIYMGNGEFEKCFDWGIRKMRVEILK